MADQQHNVYDTPRSPLESSGRPVGEVSVGILEQLRGTGPWVQFMSILFFVAAVLMVLGTLGIGVVGMMSGGDEFGGVAMAVGIGVSYILVAFLYLALGVYLFKYASAIKRCVASADADDVEQAISQQRTFWKLAGIMALVMVVLMILFMVAAVVVGIMAGTGAFG